jgi:hypothetical protein
MTNLNDTQNHFSNFHWRYTAVSIRDLVSSWYLSSLDFHMQFVLLLTFNLVSL